MKLIVVVFTSVILFGCTWYGGPDIPVMENSDGTAMSGYYQGPHLPAGTVDDGGNYDVTNFDDN